MSLCLWGLRTLFLFWGGDAPWPLTKKATTVQVQIDTQNPVSQETVPLQEPTDNKLITNILNEMWARLLSMGILGNTVTWYGMIPCRCWLCFHLTQSSLSHGRLTRLLSCFLPPTYSLHTLVQLPPGSLYNGKEQACFSYYHCPLIYL